MKLTKKECRRIANIITNIELHQMLDSAKNNIKDWSVQANINNNISKGKVWNTLVVDVNHEYITLTKFNLIREFGEYVPAHLKTYKDYKKSGKKKLFIMKNRFLIQIITKNIILNVIYY